MTQEFETGLQEKLEQLDQTVQRLVGYVHELKAENAALKTELDQNRTALISHEEMAREIGVLRDSRTRATHKIQALIQRLEDLTKDS